MRGSGKVKGILKGDWTLTFCSPSFSAATAAIVEFRGNISARSMHAFYIDTVASFDHGVVKPEDGFGTRDIPTHFLTS